MDIMDIMGIMVTMGIMVIVVGTEVGMVVLDSIGLHGRFMVLVFIITPTDVLRDAGGMMAIENVKFVVEDIGNKMEDIAILVLLKNK